MLFDTDVIIWYMRGNAKAAHLIEQQSSIHLSAVSQIELIQGMRNKRELAALQKALQSWKAEVLPVTAPITGQAVQWIEQYFLSHSLRLADAFIAATAFEHRLTLVTGNLKHYRVIPNISIEHFSPEP